MAGGSAPTPLVACKPGFKPFITQRYPTTFRRCFSYKPSLDEYSCRRASRRLLLARSFTRPSSKVRPRPFTQQLKGNRRAHGAVRSLIKAKCLFTRCSRAKGHLKSFTVPPALGRTTAIVPTSAEWVAVSSHSNKVLGSVPWCGGLWPYVW